MVSSDDDEDSGPEEFIGTWFVEGDPYLVVASPQGGLLAYTAQGTPINPAWVISRGTFGAPPGAWYQGPNQS